MRKMPIATALIVLAAVAAQAETAKTFQSLDTDANGYLSQQEAGSNPDIMNRWSDLDKNQDQKLDSAEFSAFEVDSGDSMNKTPMPGAPRY